MFGKNGWKIEGGRGVGQPGGGEFRLSGGGVARSVGCGEDFEKPVDGTAPLAFVAADFVAADFAGAALTEADAVAFSLIATAFLEPAAALLDPATSFPALTSDLGAVGFTDAKTGFAVAGPDALLAPFTAAALAAGREAAEAVATPAFMPTFLFAGPAVAGLAALLATLRDSDFAGVLAAA